MKALIVICNHGKAKKYAPNSFSMARHILRGNCNVFKRDSTA